MSAIVVGDYVKVEYQGTVTHIDGDAARLEHKGYVHWMPYEDLVPAAKPVAVGDKVTAEQADALPNGSVVYGAIAYEKSGSGRWYAAGASGVKMSMTEWLGENGRLTVLQLGER